MAYVVPDGYSDGGVVLRETGGWTEITRVSGLTGTGTAHFYVTESLLTQFKNGSVNITGFGDGGTDNTYNGVKWTGISFTHFVTPAGYRPVYIPSSGYATFYGASTCALPDGVTAYYVSATTSDKATLTAVSNIPADQGVILNGTTGIYQLYTTADAASVTGNKLIGAVTRTQMTETTDKYVLYDNEGTPEFRKITADTYLDAYKCYLDASGGNNAPALRIAFDDSDDNATTGIETVGVSRPVTEKTAVFDLSGRRVAQPSKGLYIKNGKKYFVK